MRIETFRDLKEFLGTLTEEQLNQKAGIAIDDDYHYIRSADFNDEERVWNDDMDEGNIPTECYTSEDFEGRPLNDPKNTIFPIGSIVILSDI